MQTNIMRTLNAGYLDMKPLADVSASLPTALDPEQGSMLYVHVPFCESLCPYCSFNRCRYNEAQAHAYYAALRKEMQMVAELGYNVEILNISGGASTVLIDELAQTIDRATQLFSLREVSCTTKASHLTPAVLDTLDGRVQRLIVEVQSFNDSLLKSMQCYEIFGSGMDNLERLLACKGRFESLKADMIFNFPSQTEDSLIYDLACILESGVTQVTFYPFMASLEAEKLLAATVGKVDYHQEAHFYDLISRILTSQPGFILRDDQEDLEDIFELNTFQEGAPFTFGSAWTFINSDSAMIDDYALNNEEYPAIGVGGFSYLGDYLYANTSSVEEYIRTVEAGFMGIKQKYEVSKTNKMRYRMMMQLFGLELDKAKWKEDFGVSVVAGLPVEYSFLKAASAFDVDDDIRITLTPKGRYLLVAMMREFFVEVNGLFSLVHSAQQAEEKE
jgi:coproporphyrinogen III oxidase-like Fe-S oxidoreductase